MAGVMEERKNLFTAGAALLWRRQRVLWWLFLANLIVGLVATAPIRGQLRVLDHSIVARDAMYHQMNFFRLVEALGRPEGLPQAFFSGSFVVIFLYFALLVFATGGVLETFYYDRPIRFGEFLRASAEFFWRMVRILIVFGLLMVPLALAQDSLGDLSDWIGGRSDREQLGFWVMVALTIVLALIAFVVRVWADAAQVDAIARDETAVRRSLGNARRHLRGTFWRVYATVIAIQLLLIAISIGILWLWLKLPHEWIGMMFVLGEIGVLLWLGFRLWQKAVVAAWYQQRAAVEYVPPVIPPDAFVPESPIAT